MEEKPEELLRPSDVARELGVHLYTVYGLLSSGRLKGFKLHTHWRIRRIALKRFMRSTKGVRKPKKREIL
ncbi:hypothetical protein LCGC14_0809670 [marine sediment metagenome]|uniref:Helix-turn-helix domain-containing protein n=1 Tax=marine sediment metagenome TaxID=412755 RepID=A0A0F9PRN9_9ZZZZ